jgi:DNA polymerase I
MSNSTLLLIDGHSLAFRAYYAFIKNPLRTSTGIPTSVCFGFLNSLFGVINLYQPEAIAIAFDTAKPTFRHESDVNYKANRKETPEDFIVDIINLQSILESLNLPVITYGGYEADDILGTLAIEGSKAGYDVKIVSGDRDLFQLVNEENIQVLYLDKNAVKSTSKLGITEFNPQKVEESLGIKPHQVVDYKALCGDKSDNIPGVSGIGEKTAVKLLQEYESLENIYQNIEEIKGANKKKLEAGKENAFHSQYLATIMVDMPLEVEIQSLKLQGFNTEQIKPILAELELNKFLKEIVKVQEKLGGNTIINEEKTNLKTQNNSSDNQQLSLFDTGNNYADSPSNSLENISKINTDIPIKPEIIDTTEKLELLVSKLKTFTNINVAWDTETTALEPRDAQLVGIGCCWGKNINDMAYIPMYHTEGNTLTKAEILTALEFVLGSEDHPKVFQNAKFDRLIFFNQGIELKGVVFDTMLASYLLNPEGKHNLTDLCYKYLGDVIALSYKDLEIPKGKTIADLDIQTVAYYCGMDVYSTFLLAQKLQEKIKAIPSLKKLLLEIEQPLEPVLAKMEQIGIRINIEYLNELSQQLEKELLQIETNTYEDAGEKFNLASPKQLGEILFEKLGLDKRKTKKTKTGYSTNHAILEKLQGDHPIIDKILEYRTLAKLKSTYIDALPLLVRKDTKRVHTNFNQTLTTTGRLSSSDPNLQNIPIRTEFSKQIRKAFIPQENWLLVSADYSQIELRILTHLSQEPVLLDAYKNNLDVHKVTAQLLFDKEDISSEERRLGKIINFGVIYGMGAQRFAREAGVTPSQGKEFIEKYRSRYSKVFAYLENVKKQAISQGFVETILGRRRYLNFESETIKRLKGTSISEINLDNIKDNYNDIQLLRGAANAPIQGSSADIIKIAMIKIDQILQDFQAKLLLQVHDELVFEIPLDEWEVLQTKIKETMENAVNLSIPLVVDIHEGNNWMEAK